MESRPQTRIVVCDPHPYARLGIRGVLERDPGLSVVGEAEDLGELVQVSARCLPDVVVLGETPSRSEDQVRELARVDAALVIVAADLGSAVDWIRCAQTEVQALIHTDDPGEELMTAVRRASDGTGYVSGGLSGSLLHYVRNATARRLSLVPTHTPLTSRESEVLALVRRGLANKEIARQLGLSEKTVKFHVSNVLAKAHMASRAQLIASATAM